MRILIDRDAQREPVTIPGWRVTALDGQVYPTLVADPASSAVGELLTDLTPDDWYTLDAFENPVYQLARLDHAAGHAWAYAATHPLDRARWERTAFEAEHLDAYLVRVAAWRRRHDSTAD